MGRAEIVIMVLNDRADINATLAILAEDRHLDREVVLGHGSIKSTEVYAKVALEKKIETVGLFNEVFG